MLRWLLLALAAVTIAALGWRSGAQRPVAPPQDPPPAPAQGLLPVSWPSSRLTTLPDLRALDAQDRDRAVVGGALIDGDEIVHSCLFRTTDGGRSWQPLGPAVPGARVLAVHAGHGSLWAVGHEDERASGALFTLRSQNDGTHWARFAIDTGPYPGRRLHQGELLFLDAEHGVLGARFLHRDDERASFVTIDGGEHWHFAQARSAGQHHPDREHVTTQDGWGWRLRDGIVERRGPQDSWWIPTEAQPMGGSGPIDVPYTAHRAR